MYKGRPSKNEKKILQFLSHGPSWGAEIVRAANLSEWVSNGPIYTMLGTLRQEGLVEEVGIVKTVGPGAARVMYGLTPLGKEKCA